MKIFNGLSILLFFFLIINEISAQSPSIISFSPISGSANSIIKISGRHFTGTTGVWFGETSASSFSVSNDSTINAIVGTGSTGSIKVANPSGWDSDSTTFFTFIQYKPSILSISPTSGTYNTSVTINGTHFSGVTAVTFGGTSPLSFSVSNDSTITAIVGTGSTGNIKVANSVGNDSSASIFTYNQTVVQPTIISFSPTSGSAGSSIKISGRHFNGNTGVWFGGTSASSFSLSNDSTINAIVGTGSSGVIRVTNPAGSALSDSTTLFTFIQIKPTITSFSPLSGTYNTSVTINGAHFSGATAVTFGGTLPLSFSVSNDSTITAVVGTGSTGIVKVTNSAGYDSSASMFTYNQTVVQPTIISFSPTSGSTGSSIKISGRHFTGNTGVWFGGTSASSFTVTNDSTINAIVGTGSSGVIRVTNPAGSALSDSTTLFTFIQSKPTISSFSPTSGKNGASIIISGLHFTGVTSVKFGGTSAASFSVVSDTTITAVLGTGASGWVYVTNSKGTDSLGGFSYTKTSIYNFTPTITTTGNSVIISGQYFTGTTAVSFGGTPASSFSVDSAGNNITAFVGAGSTGKIYVTTPIGSDSLSGFTFLSPSAKPSITSFSPTSGKTGDTITINGQNFTGATNVSLGHTNVSFFRVNSATSITAVIGSGSTGKIFITSPTGTDSLSGFTYNSKPFLNRFFPTSGPSGGTVTIIGLNFIGTTSVSFGGTPALSFSVVSDTTITAVLGSGSSGYVFVSSSNGKDSLSGFTYWPQPTAKPIITSFSPAIATNGSYINITGQNFTNVSSVKFGGTNASSFNVIYSATDVTINAIVAGGSSGKVYITNSIGTDSLSGFTFIPLTATPKINSFTPTTATTGNSVHISGTNFLGTGWVTFGQARASSFTVDSTGNNVTAIVASGSSSGYVSIGTITGMDSLSGFVFGLSTTPTIASFNPSKGSVGTLVTISGTNLNNLTSLNIGGVSAIPVSNDGNTLVAMVMPGAASGSINITTSGGTVNSGSNFTITSTSYPSVQQGNKLSGSGGNPTYVYQGQSVAISADGNTAIIGAPGNNGDNTGQGQIWIFTRSGNIWAQQSGKLVPSDAIGNNVDFGYSVAISADGNTAIVGGYQDKDGPGAAWIFTRNGNIWAQQGSKLVGTGATGNGAWQGFSVGLSADGNTAIVGGANDSTRVGASWIYTRTGGIWTQQGSKLVGSGGNAALQGYSVGLSADGNTAIVGGCFDSGLQGATWVFTRSGNTWTQQGNKLVGTGNTGIAEQGKSVALSADGNTAMIGGFNDNNGVGATWVFTRSANTWTQQGSKLLGTKAVGNSQQGCSVSLSADGNTGIIGGYGDSSVIGATWIFTRNNNIWTQQGSKIVPTNVIGAALGHVEYGVSVAISADGNTSIVGADADNNTKGAVRIYSIPYPIINTNSSIISFKTCSNSTSIVKSFSVSGNHLSSNINISSSRNLEFSLNSNSGFSASLSLNPIVDSLVSTQIFTRLKINNSTGIFPDTIKVSSIGADTNFVLTRDTIIALPLAPIITTNSPLTFCNGDSTILNSSASNNNQWLLNDSLINAATSTSIKIKSGGVYKVQVTNSSGCTSTSLKDTINVFPMPNAGFIVSSGCTGQNSQFIDSTSISDNTQSQFSYVWQFGDGTTSLVKNPTHLFTVANTYAAKLTVSSLHGCKDSVVKNVSIYPRPRAEFSIANSGCSNVPVVITDSSNSNGSIIKKWIWDFGIGSKDTSSSLILNHLINYANSGTYPVMLYVYSDKGCTDSIIKSISINPTPSIPIVNPIIYCQGGPSSALTAVVSSGDSLLWYNQATGGTGSTAAPVPTTTTTGKTDFYVSQKNNSSSCESQRVKLTVSIDPYPTVPGITQVANQLISSPSSYYKWYYFDSLIANYSTDTISLLSKGLYKVSTSLDNTCWSSSIEYLVQSNPSSPSLNDYQLAVYPNPANSQFYVDIKLDAEYSGIIKLSFISLSGTTNFVSQKYIFNNRKIIIPIIFNLNKQVYVLQVNINGYIQKTIKIIGQ